LFNSFDIFSDEFHCVTMDQRNANGIESTGPIPTSDPWDVFADDQFGLMAHLGIKQPRLESRGKVAEGVLNACPALSFGPL
jgi:hypothetical protein